MEEKSYTHKIHLPLASLPIHAKSGTENRLENIISCSEIAACRGLISTHQGCRRLFGSVGARACVLCAPKCEELVS